MYGMSQNCAMGPMRKAETGAAADSTLAAKPNTRPCFSKGTTRCTIVCSEASAIGMRAMKIRMPSPYSHHHSRIAKVMPSSAMPMLTSSIVRTGFLPRPNFATSAPPMMNPKLVTPRTIHHISTEKSVSPYGSMRAMKTPPTRLLNVEKRMRASSPGTAMTAGITPLKLNPFGASPSTWATPRSGIGTKIRWISATPVAAIAMATVQPMPSSPIDRPENTLVTMKAMPCTAPTRPFALSRRSPGTSRVTVVDNAMLRRFSTTPPTRITPANAQNHGPVQSSSALSGNARNIAPATTYADAVTMLESSMTDFFFMWSTITPNTTPNTATSSMYDPPMIAVASTDFVSRYTQNVSANHR